MSHICGSRIWGTRLFVHGHVQGAEAQTGQRLRARASRRLCSKFQGLPHLPRLNHIYLNIIIAGDVVFEKDFKLAKASNAEQHIVPNNEEEEEYAQSSDAEDVPTEHEVATEDTTPSESQVEQPRYPTRPWHAPTEWKSTVANTATLEPQTTEATCIEEAL
jgi:hypothetical protein